MATIDVGRVGERGGLGDVNVAEPKHEPRADGAFESQLATARATAVSTAAHGSAAKTRTIAAAATHISGGEAAASLATAYQNLFHEPPSPATLRVLVAQWSHETGGGRAMMNYNFGGIKGTSPAGLSAAYRTTEGEGASTVKITDRFRAYGSAIEGATDYVKFLSTRFSGAMANAHRGDAEGFVRALKQGGYFTGSEEDYVRSVTRLTEQARVNGFDAVGHGTAPATAVAKLGHTEATRAVGGEGFRSIHVPSAPAAGSSDPAAQVQAYYAADALAMADELCRAAMRIAAGDDERKRG
jgi:flagellum-specific peptidoglycan hydrolase FlgJ